MFAAFNFVCLIAGKEKQLHFPESLWREIQMEGRKWFSSEEGV